MLINEINLRILIESLFKNKEKKLEEGRKQREALFKKDKYEILKDYYQYYLDNYDKSKFKFDDPELRWIYNNVYQKGNKPPSPSEYLQEEIKDNISAVIQFVTNQGAIKASYKRAKKMLSKGEPVPIFKVSQKYKHPYQIENYASVDELKDVNDCVTSRVQFLKKYGASEDNLVSLGNYGNYELLVPQTKEGSVSFDASEHKTTTWCTTRRAGSNLFDGYTKSGGMLFYFKDNNISDEEASKKQIANIDTGRESEDYDNPHARFCVGFKDPKKYGRAGPVPFFPKSVAAGSGRLTVDQDNRGVTKEIAQKLLGSDFEKAMTTCIEYYKKNKGMLPFAKARKEISNSLEAIIDTVEDFTPDQEYGFLVGDRGSIKSLYISGEVTNRLVIKYVKAYEDKIKATQLNIQNLRGAPKIKKFVRFLMRMKRPDLLDPIFKSMEDDEEACVAFFDLAQTYPPTAYVQNKDFYNSECIKTYMKAKGFKQYIMKFENFKSAIAFANENHENILLQYPSIAKLANSSKCKFIKKALNDFATNSAGLRIHSVLEFTLTQDVINPRNSFEDDELKSLLEILTRMKNYKSEIELDQIKSAHSRLSIQMCRVLRLSIRKNVLSYLKNEENSDNIINYLSKFKESPAEVEKTLIKTKYNIVDQYSDILDNLFNFTKNANMPYAIEYALDNYFTSQQEIYYDTLYKILTTENLGINGLLYLLDPSQSNPSKSSRMVQSLISACINTENSSDSEKKPLFLTLVANKSNSHDIYKNLQEGFMGDITRMGISLSDSYVNDMLNKLKTITVDSKDTKNEFFNLLSKALKHKIIDSAASGDLINILDKSLDSLLFASDDYDLVRCSYLADACSDKLGHESVLKTILFERDAYMIHEGLGQVLSDDDSKNYFSVIASFIRPQDYSSPGSFGKSLAEDPTLVWKYVIASAVKYFSSFKTAGHLNEYLHFKLPSLPYSEGEHAYVKIFEELGLSGDIVQYALISLLNKLNCHYTTPESALKLAQDFSNLENNIIGEDFQGQHKRAIDRTGGPQNAWLHYLSIKDPNTAKQILEGLYNLSPSGKKAIDTLLKSGNAETINRFKEAGVFNFINQKKPEQKPEVKKSPAKDVPNVDKKEDNEIEDLSEVISLYNYIL